ncbi:MAG: 2-hydroxyacyl-CoA dehydratase family protein [Proteobacteria bacterium]|nr:2-hydroxyacyl-CoA dehydratase family protein [Pseudomonadota bacterium]
MARCERRIKKINEKPDPAKPKSNILLYELERDLRREQIEACEKGKPLGITGLGPLTRAMGMTPWDAIMAADRTHGNAATEYFAQVRKLGMPDHTCDRCSILVPMILNGDFPKPNFLFTSNFECLPVFLAHNLLAEYLQIPKFNIDRPFNNYMGERNEEQLQYVTDQIKEMVEYIETTVPDCKYNEERMIELLEYDRQYLQTFQELWKLKAAIPCPLNGRESFREIRLSNMYPDPAKAVKYMRLYVDEVGERVEKGLGAAQPEEKLRLLWSVAGPFYDDPFSWLEQRGVAVPAAEMTVYNGWFSGREPIWGDPWNGRQLSPLEEEARQFDFVWGRLGSDWVNTHLHSCRDLHLDGIIYFLQWGCPVSNNLGRVVAEEAEKQLGIPTLLIEGRMLESSGYNQKDFYAKLGDFIDVCTAWKEKRL